MRRSLLLLLTVACCASVPEPTPERHPMFRRPPVKRLLDPYFQYTRIKPERFA